MLFQILIGSLFIACTIVIQTIFIGIAVYALRHNSQWLSSGSVLLKLVVSLIGLTLWLLAALSIAVWIWALGFMVLGLFDSLEQALYFSVVAFTTLGFGDVILDTDWRLLSGLIAANGLILFSLGTAFMIEFMRRLHDAQD